MKTEFQWDVFLQKLMELPKHMNVVEAEGILTDRGKTRQILISEAPFYTVNNSNLSIDLI